jgi:hypothetical protein
MSINMVNMGVMVRPTAHLYQSIQVLCCISTAVTAEQSIDTEIVYSDGTFHH